MNGLQDLMKKFTGGGGPGMGDLSQMMGDLMGGGDLGAAGMPSSRATGSRRNRGKK